MAIIFSLMQGIQWACFVLTYFDDARQKIRNLLLASKENVLITWNSLGLEGINVLLREGSQQF